MDMQEKLGDTWSLKTVEEIVEYQRAICGLIGIDWDDVFGKTPSAWLPYDLATFWEQVNKYKDERGLNPLTNKTAKS